MPNINDFTRLYRRTITEKSDGAATITLKTDAVQPRRVRVLTHVTVEDQTTAYTKVRLGIKSGGRDHYLDELQTLAADELAVSKEDIILGDGDVFFAQLTGTTANDIIVFTCIGWEQDL